MERGQTDGAGPDPAGEPEAPASALARVFLQEDLNFLVTNRIPRRFVTKVVGRVSRIRSRRFTRATLRVWGLFADDLRIHEAESQEFETLHDCFIRRLRPDARPVDADPAAVVSPCDALVGECGLVREGQVLQAKGFPYPLLDLLQDPALAARYEGGTFVTLRLKANMYHRFHAPLACRLRRVVYVSGDTWNVNPIALRRVERLFCKNERAVLDLEPLEGPGRLTLVPVAAIAVASIRLHALGESLHLDWRGGRELACDATYAKADELGYFHAGSTIVAFATREFALSPTIRPGVVIRMGQRLFHRPPGASA